MTKDARSENTDGGLTCSWCGQKFQPESLEQTGSPVCTKCVRLLRLAGVSDDEIFGDPQQPSDKPLDDDSGSN